MALEDICSFKGNTQLNPTSSCTPLEDAASVSFITGWRSLGWTSSKRSERNARVPLDFFLPSFTDSTVSPPSIRSISVQRPFPLAHGTTTLGFIFRGGVVAAADTRASAGGLVACPDVHKIIPIHSHLVVTSSGSAADCVLWARILGREIRLYELRHGRRLSISGSAKLLAFMLHPFKGTDVCAALTLCGWDKAAGWTGGNGAAGAAGATVPSGDTTLAPPKEMGPSSATDGSLPAAARDPEVAVTCPSASPNAGPRLIYVCSDGTRLQGEVFSVGSGSPYAYGVLDGGLRRTLRQEEAVTLAREAVFRATHRDAYSGNNVDLCCITDQGWSRRERENLKEEYYREMQRTAKTVEERERTTN